MVTAATMPRELAARYSVLCTDLAKSERDPARRRELEIMAANLKVVPWNGALEFYQAMQSLWLTHMLVRTVDHASA